jgi:hypothetical protein
VGYRIGVPVHVTATAVVSANPTTLFGAVVGVAAAGQTLKLHDCAATGDAAAGNLKSTIALDGVEDFQFGTDGASFRVGLVAVVSGGTPDITVIVG